jgi:hypothetical protein
MGFEVVEKGLRYFLLGAVIVVPVWLIARALKLMGRRASDDVADANSRQRGA